MKKSRIFATDKEMIKGNIHDKKRVLSIIQTII